GAGLSRGASRAGGRQAGTLRAPVAGPVCRGRDAAILSEDLAPGVGGAGTDAALRAHAARPGLSLCGPGGGALRRPTRDGPPGPAAPRPAGGPPAPPPA